MTNISHSRYQSSDYVTRCVNNLGATAAIDKNQQKMGSAIATYTSYATYALIASIMLVGWAYTIATIRAIGSARRQRLIDHTANSYMRQIIAAQIGAKQAGRIVARSKMQRIALAEAIHLIMSHTYSTPTDKIREIVAGNELEEFLLSKLRRAGAAHSALILQYMGSMPIETRSAEIIARHLLDKDRQSRIAALIAILACRSATAIRIIGELPYRLKPYDTSRIVTLLRRGLLPIAYEPLLLSENHNLLMLGIAITHSFGIEIADKHLLNIISHNKNPQIVREAIYSLSGLGRSLGRQHIRAKLGSMNATHRRELCHHLSCEGYSLATLRVLFSDEEVGHAEPLINSYKRDLICQQSN